MYDFVIKNALIVDGTRAKPYKANVAIAAHKIVDIGSYRRGNSYEARKTIDAQGRILAPGFIDLHSHSDLGLMLSPYEPNKVTQGVTTEVAGNCGFSLFPVTDAGRPAVQQLMKVYGAEMDLPWKDGNGFYGALGHRGIGVNYLPLVGHGLLRLNVMGANGEAAGSEEKAAMGRLLTAELEAGAWGFSSGLAYMPGCFADFEELRFLAEITAGHGGVYTTHIRNQGKNLLNSVEEAIQLSRETGVAVIISHLKAYGPSSWGTAALALERIAQARSEGYRVMADFYPYDSSESTLLYEMPEWAKAGGVETLLQRLNQKVQREKIRKDVEDRAEIHWDRVFISGVQSKENSILVGKSIAEIASNRGQEPFDVAAELLQAEKGAVSTICRLMSGADVDTIAVSEATALGSDGYALAEEAAFTGHPRNWGAFPRFYRSYVQEKKLLTPEQAVYKMSGMAADFLGLSHRGRIKEGCQADLVLFDPERISGPADFQKPDTASLGIDMVMVNGAIQVEFGKLQRIPAGEIVLKPVVAKQVVPMHIVPMSKEG